MRGISIQRRSKEEIRYPNYLKMSRSRVDSAVGRWNRAMREFLLPAGPLAKDGGTLYSPPNPAQNDPGLRDVGIDARAHAGTAGRVPVDRQEVSNT